MIGPVFKLKKIALHILFWVGYCLLTFYWFSQVNNPDIAALISLRIVLIHSILFYLNFYYLLPQLVEKGRYLVYLIVVILILAGIFYLIRFSNEWLPIRENLTFRPLKKPTFFARFFFGRGLYISLASSMAILFISSTYWMNTQNQQRKQQAITLKSENLEAEMKFLKSQTNPHFLFNALNNIYALTYTNSPKAPEMIMKLSEMLRYVLYESNEKKVPLAKEIDYIVNFISFQSLKIEGRANIQVDLKNVDDGAEVEPMLFIPFIENSFKHSKIENTEKGWIDIRLFSEGNKIDLQVSNSKPDGAFVKDQTGGIGLSNVKKRLQLLYPGKHELTIEEEEKSFHVHLIVHT